MSEDETRRLFEGARLGEARALSALFDRCARKLLPLIRLRMGRSLRSDLESRDILQTVLMKSFERLGQVRDPGAVMGWMARMAENEIRDRADHGSRQRRDAARRVTLDTDAAAIPAPVRQALSQAILNEQAERLARALESLPDAQREIIVLRKLEELSFHEIAVKLGKSDDACRVAFARAMAALTLKMSEAG